jgi:hypothetical protein
LSISRPKVTRLRNEERGDLLPDYPVQRCFKDDDVVNVLTDLNSRNGVGILNNASPWERGAGQVKRTWPEETPEHPSKRQKGMCWAGPPLASLACRAIVIVR